MNSLFFALAVLLACSGVYAQTHPFSVYDMVELDRMSGLALSPSGNRMAFARWTYNLETQATAQSIWVTELQSVNVSYAVTSSVWGNSDYNPLWVDDNTLIFLSASRTSSGTSQVFRVALGGSPVQLTAYPISVETMKLFQGRTKLGFSARVYASSTMAETKQIDDEKSQDPSSAQVFDRLYFRHWDTWNDHKYSHVFTVPLTTNKEGEIQIEADPIDVMFGLELETPILPFGGSTDYDFSPDGTEVAFAALRPGLDQAWSTDYNIYIGNTSTSNPNPITEFNPAQDSIPIYSPDGTKIAYLAMHAPKYEADRRRVVVYDRSSKTHTTLTEIWDRSPETITWSADSRNIYVTVQDEARDNIYVIDVATRQVTLVVKGGYQSDVKVTPRGLAFARNTQVMPNEIFTYENGLLVQRSFINSPKLANIQTSTPEEFWFIGSLNDRVHGWIVKPVNFQENVKYPVAFLIHGGPQSAWLDNFSTRWNPQAYAGAGLVVVAIDFHGSTSYGQEFTDAINGEWGSYPYQDLMIGLDFVIDNYDYVDGNRVVGLGASYGGYMVNWINGNTDRFVCLVNHCGLSHTTGMYYATEELFFPEYDFRGTPYESDLYEKWNPINLVTNWKTPTLVIHGAKDYRVVDGQGFTTFTALQRQGVRSRLLYFSDENHWVQRPANLIRWMEEIIDWIQSCT